MVARKILIGTRKQQQGGNLWSPEKAASIVNGYKRSETEQVPVSLKRMALDGSLDVDMGGLFIGVLPNENSKNGREKSSTMSASFGTYY